MRYLPALCGERPTVEKAGWLMASPFKVRLTSEQRGVWQSLTSPASIQAFLDSIPYSAEDANRSPLRVLQERQAHCLDGGLFAAAALRQEQ